MKKKTGALVSVLFAWFFFVQADGEGGPNSSQTISVIGNFINKATCEAARAEMKGPDAPYFHVQAISRCYQSS